ncbi:MAG: magnesium/cobalt transporter CorA [Deltaproteobacteria bacterium]|nr:magnesium/cobalt transporter CorA [Deltaproteobacteria bacterium]
MDRVRRKIVDQIGRLTHHKAVVGAPPGTLNETPEARRPTIRVITYGPETIEEKELTSVAELKGLQGSAPVVWVDVDGVDHVETIRALGEHFDLHPLALEDVMNVHQRPKIEDYDDQIYAVVRMPVGQGSVQLEQVSLFFGKGWVLTLQERPGDCFDPVRTRLRHGRGRIRNAGADYLAYAVLDTIIDSYFPVVEDFDEKLERLEDRIHAGAGPTAAAELHEYRQGLHALRRQLYPTREALGFLARTEEVEIEEATRVFLRDCQDHAARLLDAVDSSRDLCAGLMDIYLSANDHRMNEVMKVLTIIATLFMPLGFIAGLYGMNFDAQSSPWNMPELSWRYGYPYALGIMAITSLLLLAFFWRRGWLGRRD